MKVWKRNAVVAAIVLFVCVAVYLNWSYSQSEAVLNDEVASAEKTLGEAALVDSDATLTLEDETAETAASATATTTESDYFATARLNREEARDSALSILQETVDDPDANAEAVSAASDSITAMATTTLQESEIENLVTAKGYTDCVAFIGDSSVSVVVASADGDLAAADIARITDIVCGETEFSASEVKVIQAED